MDLLAEQSAPPYAPGLRLAALGQLALRAPGRLPADPVPVAVRLLRQRSAQRHRTRERSGTDTLVRRIRRLRPSDEQGAALLRTLHGALGDRVGDRIALLTCQLTSPDPVDRCNAVWMSAGLFRGWRGAYDEPVRLLGAQLGTEEDRLRDAAVSALAELYALAAPAADALHALVAARPDLWTRRWERCPPALGGPLKALARTDDRRAVPALAQLLAGPAAPVGLGCEAAHLGPVVKVPPSARRAGLAASGACSGGPPGRRLGECRAPSLVLDVLGSGPGAASGGTSHALEAVGERAWRREAGGSLTTGPGPGRRSLGPRAARPPRPDTARLPRRRPAGHPAADGHQRHR